MNEKYLKQIGNIKKAIDKDVKNNNDIEKLYTAHSIPKRKFSDLFRDRYGMTAREYIDKSRYKIVEKLLRDSKNKISITTYQIAKKIGYLNSSNVNQLVMRRTGLRLQELTEMIKSE